MSTGILYHGFGIVGYQHVRTEYNGGKIVFGVSQDWHRMLVRFAGTLQKHRRGILAYYDYPISTGPLEGTNNKIKTLQKQTYGFRDKEFFKLKIYALHESKYALTG